MNSLSAAGQAQIQDFNKQEIAKAPDLEAGLLGSEPARDRAKAGKL